MTWLTRVERVLALSLLLKQVTNPLPITLLVFDVQRFKKRWGRAEGQQKAEDDGPIHQGAVGKRLACCVGKQLLTFTATCRFHEHSNQRANSVVTIH